MDNKMDYKFTYSKFFNIIFHIGVAFNIILVIWLYLIYFHII